MFDFNLFQEIWQTITRNKTRSLITAFGVAWGMFMFVILLGIGKGFETGLSQNVGDVATNSMFIFADRTSKPYKGFNPGRFWELSNEDITLLKSEIPEIKNISGILFAGFNKKTTYKERSGEFFVKGEDENYNKIEDRKVLYGRVINFWDVQEKRKVCVIGDQVYDQLFDPGTDPVGKSISVGGIYYAIIGVVKPSGHVNIGGDGGSTITIPSTTAQQLYNHGNTLDMIAIEVGPKTKIQSIEKRVESILKVKYKIAPDDEKAVGSFNIQEVFLMFHYLFVGINILIWIVGIGTLLAGVIGISNIMLVSVKERTHEIGIKRALGAKPKSITTQIMLESLTLTFIAGFVGLFIGLLVLVGMEAVIPPSEGFANPTISFTMTLITILVIIIAGLLSGILPAMNSIKIKPIDAIRDE